MATAPDGLPTALHITPHVLPANKIEITMPEFQIRADVDGFAVPRLSETPLRPCVLEFLDPLPLGPRSAPTWYEVERQFQAERDA
jgi:hypothetical protein